MIRELWSDHQQQWIDGKVIFFYKKKNHTLKEKEANKTCKKGSPSCQISWNLLYQ